MKLVSRAENIHLDLILKWLKSEAAGINSLLEMIERTQSYQQDYVINKLKNLEIEFKRIRGYIEVN